MTDRQALHGLIDGFPAVRVGVLGDLMADRFIYGAARRLSPEAPVPVVTIARRTLQAGGAANVGSNVLSLGGRLSLFGVLGDDEAGRGVRELLAAHGADLGGVITLAGRPTTVKTRVVAHSQQVVRFDEEVTAPLPPDAAGQLLKLLQADLPRIQVLVVSDYAKGVLGAELARAVVAACHTHHVRLMVDPKPVNIELYAGADVIKPNLGEALRLVGWEIEPGDEDMEQVCRLTRDRTGVRDVVITAGARGTFILAGEDFRRLPSRAREVYDVAGAGDSSLAAIALALAAGAELPAAAELGNLAGSLAVGKLGIAAITADELRARLEDGDG